MSRCCLSWIDNDTISIRLKCSILDQWKKCFQLFILIWFRVISLEAKYEIILHIVLQNIVNFDNCIDFSFVARFSKKKNLSLWFLSTFHHNNKWSINKQTRIITAIRYRSPIHKSLTIQIYQICFSRPGVQFFEKYWL